MGGMNAAFTTYGRPNIYSNRIMRPELTLFNGPMSELNTYNRMLANTSAGSLVQPAPVGLSSTQANKPDYKGQTIDVYV